MTDAFDHLFGLYEEWGRLTLRERDAIQSGSWSEVASHQEAKASLKTQIIQTTDRLAITPDKHPNWMEFEQRLRPLLQQLISSEKLNHDSVSALLARAASEKQDLERAGRNLRQIQQAYAPSASDHWHSYS